LIALATLFLGYQARDVRFTHTEANLLPDNHPINKEYTQFLETFGEEGNLIVIGVKDSLFFTSDNITAWNNLTQDILSYDETATVISLSNLKTLQKDTLNKAFVLEPFILDSIISSEQAEDYKTQLFYKLPFYEGLIYNSDKTSIRSAVYIKDSIVNTSARKDFILDKLVPLVEQFEKTQQIDVHISGMPYIRTLNSQSLSQEIEWFIGVALLVTSLIFF